MAKKSKKSKNADAAMAEVPPEPARAFISLPDSEKMAEGLENVGLGKKVKMTIHGEVTSLNQDSYLMGARMELEPSSVSVETDDEVISLDDAISESTVRV